MPHRRSEPTYSTGPDSRELTELRVAMALVVLDDAAELLAERYGPRFSPRRCRQLLMRSAELVLEHDARRR